MMIVQRTGLKAKGREGSEEVRRSGGAGGRWAAGGGGRGLLFDPACGLLSKDGYLFQLLRFRYSDCSSSADQSRSTIGLEVLYSGEMDM